MSLWNFLSRPGLQNIRRSRQHNRRLTQVSKPLLATSRLSSRRRNYLVFFVGIAALTIALLHAKFEFPFTSSHESADQRSAAPGDSGFPVVVAHVVSLIKCNRFNRVKGFLDAAAVLRHSIHQQSNYTGNSRYSYQMVALVHPTCQENAAILKQLGYNTTVVNPPIQLEDLAEGFLRGHVEAENCCGKDEFIKLYAYTLTEYPVVVHWDMDIMVLQPMDSLFDAIIFPKDSMQGQQARRQLELQHPQIPLPDVIDAFITRDITSSRPWEVHQGVQGGFVVARPSRDSFNTYLQFIREANYSRGRGAGSGWGGLGYGGFQGAMAYQGVLAYFYDQYKPNTAVELNICRWNQVVADVVWRGPIGMEYNGTCREFPKLQQSQSINKQDLKDLLRNHTNCEDCRVTPVELVKTVHYTACNKPWECELPYPPFRKNPRERYPASELTNITTCGLLFRKWFEARKQIDGLLANKSLANYSPAAPKGGYFPEYFMGYCRGPGRYIAMNPPPAEFDVSSIYFEHYKS